MHRPMLLLALLIVPGLMPSPARAQINLPPERPHDPPGCRRIRRPFTAASLIVFGRFVSIQVNVNGSGANIVGDAANEPSIAVDPGDHHHMAIGWRQFDTVRSDFRQAGFGYTTNGGLTWTAGKVQPGAWRTDPVLAVDADGDFFYGSGDADLYTQLFPSTNHGMTWGSAVESERRGQAVDDLRSDRRSGAQLRLPGLEHLGELVLPEHLQSLDRRRCDLSGAEPREPALGSSDLRHPGRRPGRNAVRGRSRRERSRHRLALRGRREWSRDAAHLHDDSGGSRRLADVRRGRIPRACSDRCGSRWIGRTGPAPAGSTSCRRFAHPPIRSMCNSSAAPTAA